MSRATAVAAALAILVATPPGLAADAVVEARRIATLSGAAVGEPVQGLIWRGGLTLTSDSAAFGGLSAIGFSGEGGRLIMVSDHGNFVAARLQYDAAGPLQLVDVTITAIPNSKGDALPLAYTRDAEALSVIERDGAAAAIRVGFENLTRVADFDLVDGVPSGPAREVPIPDWISALRTNESLESVCIAPPASPVAGSTLLIIEQRGEDGTNPAFLLGRADRGALRLRPTAGVVPTDCAFLPNGDLLVLERGTVFLSFSMRLRRIAADEVRPGGLLSGEVVLELSGGEIDNMEGLAVHPGPDGGTRITLISDNNFNGWERNLLLEFSLPQEPLPPAAAPALAPASPITQSASGG